MNTEPIFSDQEFDEELREFFQTQKQEKLTAAFTANVMEQVKAEDLSVKYTPVISSRTFFVIALLIGILVVWAIVQPGTSSDGIWSLPAFSASQYYDLLNNWQQIFYTFSLKWISSSAIFLPLGGLLLALSVHYIFLAVLKNRTIKKVEQLYCF